MGIKLGIHERQNLLIWMGIGITIISLSSGIIYNKHVGGPKMDTYCVIDKKPGTKMMDDRNGSGIYVKIKYDHLGLEEIRFIENPFISDSYIVGKHYKGNQCYIGIQYELLAIITAFILFVVLGLTGAAIEDESDNYN